MEPVLTEVELAELLRVERGVVERLVAETSLPRVTLAGHVRFVTADVLSWLSRQREPLLAAGPADRPGQAPAREEAPAPEGLPAAEDDQTPLVSLEALEALGPAGGADPARNLARQQARDALIALGDALHQTLTHLSGGRLHPYPEEARRTSPWRLEPGGEPIEALVLPWAAGEQPEPGFEDRPRVELRLSPDALSLSLRVPAGVGEPPSGAHELYGPSLEGPDEHGWAVTLRHPFGGRPPTAGVAKRRLERDLEHLVPLWREVVVDAA